MLFDKRNPINVECFTTLLFKNLCTVLICMYCSKWLLVGSFCGNIGLWLQHDYPAECRPGGLSGNFIMFASATSGDRPNNSKFSSCSVGNISNVLDAIEDKKKRNCFEGLYIHSLALLISLSLQEQWLMKEAAT